MTDTLLDADTLNGSTADAASGPTPLPTLTIVAHPDCSRVGQRRHLPLLGQARGLVSVSRREPVFEGAPLLSPFISRKPVVFEGRGGGAVQVDASRTSTRVVIDGVPLTGVALIAPERLDAGVVIELGTHIALLLHREPAAPSAPGSAHGLVGDSEGIRRVRDAIERLGPDTAAVLIRGETGTGKELVAAALHAASPRCAGPFVTVNMAAIPASLAASELFGHARGAFSGAREAHDGFFARADGGTLFLDEVADAPMDLQAALLRVMETGEVQAVGASRVRRVDVRVLAATDADLERAAEEGRFRAPLLYRLATGEIPIPPLRERRADIARLAVHFLGLRLGELGRRALLSPEPTDKTVWLPAGLMARLARCDWPGNVRQLRNVCRQLAARSEAPLSLADPEIQRLLPAPDEPAEVAPPRRRPPRDIDPDELLEVMRSVDFKLGEAASRLGISRPSLNLLVDRHPRLRRARHLEAAEIRSAMAEAQRTGQPAWRLLQVSDQGLRRRKGELGLT